MTQKQKWFFYSKLYPLLILVGIMFMSIGYATVNGIQLTISGDAMAKLQNGIYITEAVYSENSGAGVEESFIKSSSGTIMNAHMVLSSTSSTSYIKYQVTVYNGYDYDCKYNKYTFDDNFYDNENIVFELTNLNTDTVVSSKKTHTFYITFKYKNGITPSTTINDLSAYIHLDFIRTPYIVGTYNSPGTYSYTIPENGIYRIQLWGASGYNSSYASHAIGGYTQGDIELTSGTELHFYVGGKGKALSSTVAGTNDGGGYNGGGNASNSGHAAAARYGGGGATDVRLVNGEWNLFDSLKSRIMVAGGGGSWSQSPNYGGSAGGLIGYGDESDYSGGGGTQTSGGLGKTGQYGTSASGGFGYGGDGSSYASGGGGGYYGGGGGARDRIDGSGGGGSSFISGHEGCDAITETSIENNIVHTGQSIHYSGLKFTNTLMIDGNGYKWTTQPESESQGSLPGYTSETTLNLTTSKDGYAIIWRVPTE